MPRIVERGGGGIGITGAGARPDYGIEVAGVYHPVNNVLTEISGSGGTSPVDAPADVRSTEAAYAEAWFRTITSEVFG